MKELINKNDVVKLVAKKLSNERIVVGGNKEFYKRKYHLKITQKVILKVINAFWDVVAEAIEEGNTVSLNNYIKMEPRYCKARSTNMKEYIPAQYRVKFTAFNELKQACASLTEKELL